MSWFTKRLTHSCVVRRDTGTARSDSGQVIASISAVGTPSCRFTERSEDLANEAGAQTVTYDAIALFGSSTDVQIHDTVDTITYDSTSIGAGTYTVEELLTRRDYRGKAHHMTAGLERVNTL